MKKMESSNKFFSTCFIMIGLFFATMIYVAYPIRYNVKGTVTDWIGNNDGFGLKINNVEYWLNYNGKFVSNVSMPFIIGRECVLIYEGTFLSPKGNCPSYANLIILVIQ